MASYIGRTPTIGNFQKCDAISVVNGQATYGLTVNSVAVYPESANHVLCSLNGILQAPQDSFTISSSNIVFASNLSTGDVIDFVMILGNVLDLGVPSDNTVSLAKLTATGTKDATTFLRGDNTFATAGGTNTPAFSVKKSANQTISTTTTTKMELDSEFFDTDNKYDNSTNYRFTPGVAGKYFFYASTAYQNYAQNKPVTVSIHKNGSSIASFNNITGSYSDDFSASVSVIDSANTTDYFEAFTFHRGSSTETMIGSASVFIGYKLIE